LAQESAAINHASGGTKAGDKSHTKNQKWAVQHAKAACSGGTLFGFNIKLACQHQVKPNKNSHLLTYLLSQSGFSDHAPSIFHLSGYYVPLGNQLRWGRFHEYK